MFFDCRLFVLLVSIASSIVHGMEEEIFCNLYLPPEFLPVALMEGNAKKLSAFVSNPNIHPDTTIHTEVGCLDPFTYLVLQQLTDESKTYECADILWQAKFHITLPSETILFTVFHFVKSKNMFDYFIEKANITKSKDLLDRYYPEEKQTLFQKLIIELVPTCELKAMYHAYKPSLHHITTANGTILHELLGFFLFHTLNAQFFYSTPVQPIGSFIPENAFTFITTYDYVNETYNKFKFLVEDGKINHLATNEYSQTPYDFYILLLNELQKNDSSLCKSQCPEHIQFITRLFNQKEIFEDGNINLERFLKDGLRLAELIVPFYKVKIVH